MFVLLAVSRVNGDSGKKMLFRCVRKVHLHFIVENKYKQEKNWKSTETFAMSLCAQ